MVDVFHFLQRHLCSCPGIPLALRAVPQIHRLTPFQQLQLPRPTSRGSKLPYLLQDLAVGLACSSSFPMSRGGIESLPFDPGKASAIFASHAGDPPQRLVRSSWVFSKPECTAAWYGSSNCKAQVLHWHQLQGYTHNKVYQPGLMH